MDLIAGFSGLFSYIIPFLFVLTIVVFFHELGHFQVARWCGVKVDAFSIGFGPEVFGWNDKRGTRWKVSWIPLGGYVKFHGDVGAASVPDQERLERLATDPAAREIFHFKPLWQRAAVVAAGPIANFILAIVIFAGTFMTFGERIELPRLGTIEAGSPAEAAGLKTGDLVRRIDGRNIRTYGDVARLEATSADVPLTFEVERDGEKFVVEATPGRTLQDNGFEVGDLGIDRPLIPAVVASVSAGSAADAAGLSTGDRILEIDGKSVNTFNDLREVVSRSPGQALELRIDREGEVFTRSVTPKSDVRQNADGTTETVGLLGIRGQRPGEIVTHNPFTATWRGTEETGRVIERTMTYLWRIVNGREKADQLGGPIRIAQVSGEVAQVGIVALINLAAVLSVSIGLLNLFPIPLLDGGHLAFYGYEAIAGRPLSERMQEMGFRVGLALVLMLMLFATWNDINHLMFFN